MSTMTTVTLEKPLDRELGKPIAGLVFVLGWALAIVLWSILHNFTDAGLRGFLADFGIIAAAVGFSAPFLRSKRSLIVVLAWSFLALGVFALTDFSHVHVIVYMLRIGIPLLALLSPLYKLLSFRVF